jgi:VCBS repeat-containing protein
LNFNGIDTFTFKANDGELNSTPGTVTVTVTPVPDLPIAQDETFMPVEDTLFSGQATASDPDGDPITFMLVTGTTNGQLTFNADGSFTYDPDPDFDGVDSFTFKASDLSGDSNTATVTLDVQSVNDPPVASAASFSTPEDMPLTAPAPIVDVDGDDLVFTLVMPPSNGTVVFDPDDNTFTYTPDPEFFGPDLFSFTANDGTVESNLGSVTITVTPVNDPPNAVDDPANPTNPSFTTSEDQQIARNFSVSLFSNDSDPEGDPIQLDSFDAVSALGAVVTVFGDGGFSYDPRGSQTLQNLDVGDTAVDTFTYTITDGAGGFDTATVTIQVSGVNDVPVAVDDEFSGNEDTVLTINGSQLLANDFDPEGTTTPTINSVSGPSAAGALVTFNMQTGVITYDPRGSAALQGLGAGDSFDDTFTYTIRDGSGVSAPATVTISVSGLNDAPTAAPDSASTETNIATMINVLANDTDPDSTIDMGSVQIVANPTNGTVSVNSLSGVVTYRSDSSFTGTDTFTYRVADAEGVFSAPATVTVTVNQRIRPWRNPNNSLDVNADGNVTILDAILVVGVLRNFGVDVDLTDPDLQSQPGFPQPNIAPFVDVFDNPSNTADDDRANLQDLLTIIDFLRTQIPGGGELEGEGELESDSLTQAVSVFDAGAVDGSFPGYRALTDISSQSYFRRLEEQEQDAAIVAAVGELGLPDDETISVSDDPLDSLHLGDDDLHLTALDALFSEGFEP